MLKKSLIALLVLALTLLGYLVLTTPPEFRAQENPAEECQSAVFDKSALVFEAVLLCGTSAVPAEKLRHAASVAAEWLDNDEDGVVDDPRLLRVLHHNKPVIVMTLDGMPLLQGIRIFSAFRGFAAQDLGAEETNTPGRRDASQEEIHHLIMNAEWQALFPDVFGEQVGDDSDLFRVWKYANDNGYYSYDDPTCSDSCKVTEFVYLATAAYLDSQADLFSDELTLKTREALLEVLPEVVHIFEAEAYVYPRTHWPDGRYPHSGNITFFGL
jgi:hypothetical protein